MHRWEEVTAAGLLLLAAGAETQRGTPKSSKRSTDQTHHETHHDSNDPNESHSNDPSVSATPKVESKDDSQRSPAILVYGACDGLLASFLAQHAPEAGKLEDVEM